VNQIQKDSNALYLQPPHARLIWEGEKILILKKRKFENMLNKELFLASEDKIWGKITLTSVFPLTREQVEATRFAHKVSEEEIKKWWGNPTVLYAYTFTFKKYEKPQPRKLLVGVQTFFELKTSFTDEDLEKMEYFWDLDMPRTCDWIIDFAEVLRHLEGKTVLDLGCGEGSSLEILERSGYKAKGIEKYNKPYEVCKSKGLNVVKGDAQNLRYKDESFDSVMSMHLLEHVEDDEAVLKESIRVAKNVAVHVVPLGERKDPTHLRIYTLDDVEQLCQKHGCYFYTYPSGKILEGKEYPRENAIIICPKTPQTFHKRYITLNKPGLRAFEPEEIFEEKEFADKTLVVAKKFDGFNAELIGGDEPHVYSEDGILKDGQLKNLLTELRKLKGMVLASQAVMYRDGEPLHRTETIRYLNSKKYDAEKEDSIIFHVYDVYYYQGRDVRNLPYVERLKLLQKIKATKHIKPMKVKWGFRGDAEAYVVSGRETILDALDKVRKMKGSEGAIVSVADMTIQDKQDNMKMLKIKNLKELDVMIVRTVRNAAGSYNHVVAAGPYPAKCGRIVLERKPKKAFEKDGKVYAVLGKTFNTTINPGKFKIIRINVLEVVKEPVEDTGCYTYSFMTAKVLAPLPERSSPDSLNILDRLAKETLPKKIEKFVRRRGDSWCVLDSEGKPIKCYSIREFGEEGAKEKANRLHRAIMASKARRGKIKKVEELIPELYRELAKEGEPLPEKYYKFHPDCKPCRWVLQKHEPGRKVEAGPEKPLIEEEVRKEVLESELFRNLISKSIVDGDIILKFRDHLDLRIQIGKNKAVGWGLHPPQKVPGGVVGEFIRRLKSHKQTQSAAKLLMEGKALNWLDVGKKGRVEIPAGKPGASRVRTAYIEAIDWGTVKFGVQRKDLHEYFFKSEKGILEGRFIARVLKVGDKLNWYLWKPKDQKPMNPILHNDEGYPYVILNEDLTEDILEKD